MNNLEYIDKLNLLRKKYEVIENSIEYYNNESRRLSDLTGVRDEIKLNGFHYDGKSKIGKLIISSLNIDITPFSEAIEDLVLERDELLQEIDILCNTQAKGL